MRRKKLCIGLLTHCDSRVAPKRFEILKRSVGSLQGLQRDSVYIYVWDNSSSKDVREYLKSKDFFDAVYFSDKNYFDLVAVHKLVAEAKKIDAQYVCHLEDDLFFYDHGFLNASFRFLDENSDCGYLRILKYEYENQKIYDKSGVHPLRDKANYQRHYNQITKEELIWEQCGELEGYVFLKNNWHWYNFANICRTDVFEKIIPRNNHQPLQKLEGYMMKKYFDLGLKVGVLDLGAATHLGEFTTETSQRLKVVGERKKLPIINYSDVVQEIKTVQKEIDI